MEPKLPMPNPSPERAPFGPTRVSSPEISSGAPTPEVSLDQSREKGVEQAREQLSGMGVADAAVFGAPVGTAPMPVSNQQQADDSGMPLVAADEDLIEQEWVKKAKDIVLATKDDPYSQEREVSKLQASYLKKRYGKEIRLSN